MEIKASEFKARCLQLLDEVGSGAPDIVITKRGKAVARLCAYRPTPPSLLGLYEHAIVAHDDLVEPVGDAWDAERS